MNFADIFGKINSWEMPTPSLYGWFHILFLVLMVVGTFLLCHFFRNSSTKTMKIICLVCEIVLVVLEIIKQLANSCRNGVFAYDWESFPFQLCETPMYVLLVMILNKNEKVQNILITYMATYAMFAGLTVMVWPSTVLNNTVFGNVRALTQHAIQVAIGIYLMAWNRKNFTLKNFFYSGILFVIFCFIAIFINKVVESQTGAKIAMFYLSETQESAILIVRKIKPYVPFAIYVLSYIVGVSACAYLTYETEMGIYRLSLRRAKKQSSASN